MKIRVTQEGVVIPKRLFKGIEQVEIRRESSFIMVIPKPKEVKEDPIFRLGTAPVSCNTPDASENTDKYIYSGNL